MAKQTSVNNAYSNGVTCLFQMKEFFKLHGWTVPQSSDGTTYNASGDQITGDGAGAGGLNNAKAWFILEDPGAERQFCFQKTSLAVRYAWRIKYSALDGFTGGSPDATETPSATDEAILIGGGTDAAPTYTNFFNISDTITRFHIVMRDDANSRGVYGFWCWTVDAGSEEDTVLICDPIDPAAIPALVGTRASPTTGDPDPCVLVFSGALTTLGSGKVPVGISGPASPAMGWFQFNGTNGGTEAFVAMASLARASANNSGAAGTAVNPYDGADELDVVEWGRDNPSFVTQLGRKGPSQYMKVAWAPRAYPDTFDLATDARVALKRFVLPWEENTVPQS